MGAHLGLDLKNERKTKFRQLRVKLSSDYFFFILFFFYLFYFLFLTILEGIFPCYFTT